MEKDQLNQPSGLTKRQIVLYGALGLVGIVFFAFVFWFGTAHLSDTRQASVTDTPILETSSQPIGDSTDQADTSPSEPVTRQFTFEIVASDALRARGLGGRTEVPQDYGMLFVFKDKQRYGFWMKDMKTSIDIIWLSDTVEVPDSQASSATIIGIEENVSPSTYPATFTAPAAVRYVLETRAGEARRQGWGVGTLLALPSSIPVPQ